MLKVFRDKMKYLAWILWLVILVFILFVFVDFGGTVPTASGPSGVAVKIGSDSISFPEFERAYRQAESFYRQTYGEQFSSETARQIGLPIQVLEGLVNDRILLLEADQMGIEVTDEEIRTAILGQSAFQDENGAFVGEETYRRILRSNGYNPESYEQVLRGQLLTEKTRSVLAATIYVPDADVEENWRNRTEKATIKYIELPADRYRDRVSFDPTELESFFAAHQEDFRVAEKRKVNYLLVEATQLRDTLRIDDQEIQSFYDGHKEDYTQGEQVRARHILLKVSDQRTAEEASSQLLAVRARIESGENFATLASEITEDPVSKQKGGDLGYFERGRMVRQFEEAAFGATSGELVGPIETDFGFHLIEVMDRRAAGARPFEDVAQEIREQLLVERSTTLAESTAAELADRLSREDIRQTEDLAKIADEQAGVSFQNTGFFGRDDNVPGIGRATAFTVAAFDLQADEVSEPIRLAQGWALIRIEEIQSPRIPELAEVRSQVEEQVLDRKQLDLAMAQLETDRGTLGADFSFTDLAEVLELALEEPAEFGRQGSVDGLGADSDVIDLALTLEVGQLGGPLERESSAVLFEVVDRKFFDQAEFESNRASTLAAVESQRLNELLASFIAQRREKLKVTYDPQLLQTFEIPTADAPSAG
jgi:peptidyl-prolyl cis-trans isomerase D